MFLATCPRRRPAVSRRRSDSSPPVGRRRGPGSRGGRRPRARRSAGPPRRTPSRRSGLAGEVGEQVADADDALDLREVDASSSSTRVRLSWPSTIVRAGHVGAGGNGARSVSSKIWPTICSSTSSRRDDADRVAGVVDHDRQVHALVLEALQQVVQAHRLADEHRRPHDPGHALVVGQGDELLDVQHALDVHQRALVDRQAAVARAQRHLADLRDVPGELTAVTRSRGS